MAASLATLVFGFALLLILSLVTRGRHHAAAIAGTDARDRPDATAMTRDGVAVDLTDAAHGSTAPCAPSTG